MFTGIIQSTGVIASLEQKGGDVRIAVKSDLDLLSTALGDSIACNGCCLTVTSLEPNTFYADVSRETLAVTTLSQWQIGTHINLEKALRVGDALGGHYVSGHVDCVGRVVDISDDARSVRMRFALPLTFGRYVAQKGSICIDGVSLTVNQVEDAQDTVFDVNLVPHTLEKTILKQFQIGTQVNIEIDMIARYLDRMQTAAST
jgi:riboflavin synthase